MRKIFEQQLSFDIIPIEEVKLPERSRDELPPVLKALQYIYTQPSINNKIFNLLKDKVFSENNKTGRPGMSLWEILVLGIVRLCLDIDYDRLLIVANYDKLTRSILGIEAKYSEPKQYSLQSLKDNIYKIDDNILEQINQVVVEAGYALKKKEPEPEPDLVIKIDTYALETNVHFPTDISLLWDSLRKSFDMIHKLLEDYTIEGWRKILWWRKQAKNQFRDSSRKCFTKGYNTEKKQESVIDYLDTAKEISIKVEDTLSVFSSDFLATKDMKGFAILCELEYYKVYLDKQIDLVERRIIKGETIPASEKVHSIFEPYTEWLQKGKAGNKVELGLKVLIATDQFNYIRHYQVVEQQVDSDITVSVLKELIRKYPLNAIKSFSTDKGFSSKQNKTEILDLFEGKLIMPKRGKLNLSEKEEENSKEFKKLKNAHSAVEANINQLEHNGLNRCPDKGIDGFKRYVGFGILSYNLHHLGKDLIQKENSEKLKTIKKEHRKKLIA